MAISSMLASADVTITMHTPKAAREWRRYMNDKVPVPLKRDERMPIQLQHFVTTLGLNKFKFASRNNFPAPTKKKQPIIIVHHDGLCRAVACSVVCVYKFM